MRCARTISTAVSSAARSSVTPSARATSSPGSSASGAASAMRFRHSLNPRGAGRSAGWLRAARATTARAFSGDSSVIGNPWRDWSPSRKARARLRGAV